MYPDTSAQTKAAFEVAPTLSSLTILSNFIVLKLNKRMGIELY